MGAICVFPFKFKRHVYSGCTTVTDENNRPWCSTKVDIYGKHVGAHGEWGYCEENCPVDGNIPIKLILWTIFTLIANSLPI